MANSDDHAIAVKLAKIRDPKAWKDSIEGGNQIPKEQFMVDKQLKEIKKGCKCKKTKCQKKYCECFNTGQICGIFCQCQGCSNC